MKYKDIIEQKKRIEFNMTESEVLVRLVDNANSKGEKVQKENKRLRKLSRKVLKSIPEKTIFKEEELPKDYDPTEICAVGIDGSYYLVGGVGGKWYYPYSIVRILFENGLKSMPKVDIFSADIGELEEQTTPNVNLAASLMMLIGETKAIDNWGAKNLCSIVFIDGPVADPPTYEVKDYIEDRCKALIKCLTNSLIIGCVKRSRDMFFLDYFDNLRGSEEGILKKDFLSDQYLFAYLFSNFRFENDYRDALYSNYINISDYGIYSTYKEYGVCVFALFYQKSIQSKIMRIDVPILNENIEMANEIVFKAIKAAADWQYPGQYIPLPIELAHEKCKIREGAAEILYEEILTKSRSSNIEDQLIMLQLR